MRLEKFDLININHTKQNLYKEYPKVGNLILSYFRIFLFFNLLKIDVGF
jgi:hypothetical protein